MGDQCRAAFCAWLYIASTNKSLRDTTPPAHARGLADDDARKAGDAVQSRERRGVERGRFELLRQQSARQIARLRVDLSLFVVGASEGQRSLRGKKQNEGAAVRCGVVWCGVYEA